MKWQPIDTAPRDATDVLLFVPETDEIAEMVISGWFDQGLTGGKWMVGGGMIAFEDASHWMPLPEAPEAA